LPAGCGFTICGCPFTWPEAEKVAVAAAPVAAITFVNGTLPAASAVTPVIVPAMAMATSG
jgi:hypothetical protein